MISGVSASGKSTFARKLAEKIRLPLVFIDSILWKPRWSYIGDSAAMQEIKTISQQDTWIIEGYVNPEIKQILFERADTIIFLEYSRLIILFRYIQRYFKHRINPRPELNGNAEKFRWKMIKRIWQKQESNFLKHYLDQPQFKNKVIHLHTPKETRDFLNGL